MLCFPLTDRTALENVKERWAPAIEDSFPEIPFVLVGTMKDERDRQKALADDNNGGDGSSENVVVGAPSWVSDEEADEVAQDIGANKYVACSAITMEKVESVFEEAVVSFMLLQMDPNCVVM